MEVQQELTRLLTQRYHPTLFARDVMTTPVKSITGDATITEAERATDSDL